MQNINNFVEFMHPGNLCKCCNAALVVSHPSQQCTCCIVDWESGKRTMSLADFIAVKTSSPQSVAKSAAVKDNNKDSSSNSHKDINIIVDSGFVLPSDSDFFFNNEEVHTFSKEITFADILTRFEFFPSKGQARKGGWDKPIPTGFNEFTIGKLKHHLSIWNPSNEWAE